MQRVLFSRIGWMTYYKDIQTGDSRVYGGGKYNKKHIGGEYRNFLVRSGKVYGAFANQMKAAQLNISRIDPKSSHGSTSNVLVVFFAKHRFDPSMGQVVVGWHRNATVHSQWTDSPWWHYSVAPSKGAVLLPTKRRTCIVPHGSKKLVAPGRSNVFFAFEANGEPRKLAWLNKVLDFVNSYDSPNLLIDAEAEFDSTLEEVVESGLSSDHAQGFQPNPKIRKAVENHAMNSAKRHFSKKGFQVRDVSSTHPYDLCCYKGKEELYVEVKGSQIQTSKIVLTPNEVSFLSKNKGRTALYLLHSIRLQKRRTHYSAKGGTIHVEIN